MDIYHHIGTKIDKNFINSIESGKSIIFDSSNCWIVFRSNQLKGQGFITKKSIRLSRGRLFILKDRLIAIAGGYKIIDIPKNHELFKKLKIDTSNPKRYIITVNVADFSNKLEGDFTLSYHTKVNY